MLSQKSIIPFLVILFVFGFVSQASAQTEPQNLGNPTPSDGSSGLFSNGHGVLSNAEYYVSDGEPYYNETILASQQTKFIPSIDQSALAEVEYQGRSAWARTAPYDFHGYLDATNLEELAPDAAERVGYVSNHFLDEFYFETVDGIAASLTLNFDLHFAVQVVDTGKDIDASFGAVWFDPTSMSTLDRHEFDFFKDADGSYSGSHQKYDEVTGSYSTTPLNFVNDLFTFDEAISLSTNGWGFSRTTGLIESGTYLPIELSMMASASDVGNVIFDYSDSMTLNKDNPYDVFDVYGNKLPETGPLAFTLDSLENFDQPGTSTVPEPTTMSLMAIGLFGLARYRKKIKS